MDRLRSILQSLLLTIGAVLLVINLVTISFNKLLAGEEGGLGQFSSPVALVNSPNNLYFLNHDQMQVLALDKAGKLHLIAGNGSLKFSGEGGLATQAGMYVIGMTRDQQGNLYLADHGNHRIRRVDTKGRIITLAGTGKPGFSGDGGAALQAQLNNPVSLAVNTRGELFISDYANHRIRKIDASGKISTLAGTGKPGFSADGTLATQAQINSPWGIALDCSGRVIYTDLGSASVKRLDQGKITTLIKNLGRPTGLAVACAPTETIYVSDTNTQKIYSLSQGVQRVIAGASPQNQGDSGPALSAQFSSPYGLAIDGQGQLLIADTNNNRLRLIDRNGRITTLLTTEP